MTRNLDVMVKFFMSSFPKYYVIDDVIFSQYDVTVKVIYIII